MARDSLVLAIAAVLAICVIGIGFSGGFAPADMKDLAVYTGNDVTAPDLTGDARIKLPTTASR
jgi:hypothetical protein